MSLPGRVLVTGANGMIGRSLTRYLTERKYLVRGLDLRGDWSAALDRTGVECINGDLRDVRVAEDALAGIDYVVHLASAHLEVGKPASYFWSINVDGTRQLAELAAGVVKRFIYVSSVGVYGGVRSGRADEQTACHPTIAYEKSKLAAEKEIVALAERQRLPAIIIRPSWVYGAECDRTRKLIAGIRRGLFVLAGRGQNLRHPLYVEDMNRAFETVLVAQHVEHGEVYVVAGPESVTSRELVERLIAKVNPRCRIVTVPRMLVEAGLIGVEAASALVRKHPPVSRRTIKFFVENSAFDTSKFAREFDFVPSYSLDDGLDATLSSLA